MSSVKAPSHDLIAKMAADVDQLVKPIHTAIRGRIVSHLPLLDQLRDACIPGNSVRGPERRSVPDSRPPLRLDAVDTLSTVYVEISQWHALLQQTPPTPDTDWWKAVLRQFVGTAPNVAPSLADELAHAVNGWWRLAAVVSGWRPEDLLKLR